MRVMVLLSGGIDSTTLLWHLQAEGHECEAVGIYYGQRHSRELQAAALLASERGVVFHPLSLFMNNYLAHHALGGGTLPTGPDQSATVVPGRNLLFIAAAAMVAAARSCSAVAVGCQGGDHETYPDCREEWLAKVEPVLGGLALLRPFVGWSKAAVVDRGRILGVPLERTWSCYAGGKEPCGVCGACTARKAAGA